MKTNSHGSVLSVVMMCVLFVGIIAASTLSLINTQRRLILQKELQLQANSAAETALDYAYSYVINDINKNTLNAATTIPATGYKPFVFSTSVTDFLLGDVTMHPSYSGRISGITLENLEVRVLAKETPTRYFVDSRDPSNTRDRNKNQWVRETLVPIVATIKARQGKQSYIAHVQKAVSSREVALFQYAIFFQGQLHMHRGYRPMGGVHSNGNLFLNAHNGDTATYNGAVTSASNIYRGSTFDQGGSGSDTYGYVPVTTTGTIPSSGVNPSATGLSGQLKIYVEGDGSASTDYAPLGNLDSRTATWKADATKIFKGHLEDKAHQIAELTPVGSEGYRQDVSSTGGINEFNNSPYSLIEPNLPASPAHASFKPSLDNSLQAKASLIFIVEYNDTGAIPLRRIDGSTLLTPAGGTAPLNFATPGGVASRIANPWAAFVVRAYKVNPNWDFRNSDLTKRDIHQYLIPIPLPDGVIGEANPTVTSIITNGRFEPFQVDFEGTFSQVDARIPVGTAPLITAAQKTSLDATSSNNVRVKIAKGLFDSRLGRAVSPLTIDIAKLKYVLEAPIGTLIGNNLAFRQEFNPTAWLTSAGGTPVRQWNGLVYVEFPTSLTLQNTTAGAVAGKYPAAPVHTTSDAGVLLPGRSRSFAYGVKETLHPDRSGPTDTRAARADSIAPNVGIVPLAPELREYPATGIASLNSTILDERYAIPALQLINGRQLPNPNPPVAATDPVEGFSVATNAPLYLVGNYNADGDYTTGTNITSSAPDAYSDVDPSINEIPSAIFCDTFTVLSNGWGEGDSSIPTAPYVRSGTNYTRSNRENSFYGSNRGSNIGLGSVAATPGTINTPPGRRARERTAKIHPTVPLLTMPATSRYVEISACIATGEYPIFEFFTHALESYADGYGAMPSTLANPIIFKGSLVGMFHSEIQHIKQAYGRNVGTDIQVYWEQHGAMAIAASRYHTLLMDGNFPPGTPMAYTTEPKAFRLLRRGFTEDDTVLSNAGF